MSRLGRYPRWRSRALNNAVVAVTSVQPMSHKRTTRHPFPSEAGDVVAGATAGGAADEAAVPSIPSAAWHTSAHSNAHNPRCNTRSAGRHAPGTLTLLAQVAAYSLPNDCGLRAGA